MKNRKPLPLLWVKAGIAALTVLMAVACTNDTAQPSPVTPPPTMALLTILTQASEEDGMTQVYVPAGEFLMGSSGLDPDAEDDEKPQHTVYLNAFWIDRTEVTNTMFAQFVAETGYRTSAEKEGWGRPWTDNGWQKVDGADWQHPHGPDTSIAGLDDHPVILVSWYDAKAYCEWAGRRLPTEAQWEKAARGTDGRLFPWGNQAATCDYAVMKGNSGRGCGEVETWPVGGRPKGVSPYGALDMSGNVWEWVDEWYTEYPGTTHYSSNYGMKNKVLRGGGWYDGRPNIRAANRDISYAPNSRYGDVGFRCVAEE